MAKSATIAAAMVLMAAQPVSAAWAQSTDDAQTTNYSQRRGNGAQPFFGSPDRILIALGALTTAIIGFTAIVKGNGGANNNGPRPTSP